MTKLFCCLPGIEKNLIEVLQAVSNQAREALDRKARMHRSMKELRIELSAMKVELEAVKGKF